MSVVPPPPPPPPQVQANPELFRNPFKANSAILLAAKAALKSVAVPIVEEAAQEGPAPAAADAENGDEHSYALAAPPSPALEISVEDENISMEVNISRSEALCPRPKKAKLLVDQ